MHPNEHEELTSWKEISEYLGVTARTAQKWEKEKGLPIKRLGSLGRVSAICAELDAWRELAIQKPSWWENTRFLKIYSATTTAIILIGLGAVIAAYVMTSRAGRPALFRIEHNVLVVTDSQSRELWRNVFEQPMSADNYRTQGDGNRRIWFGDIDKDGRIEVLFVYVPITSGTEGMPLICFSDKGVARWRFTPGKTVYTAPETFAPPYWLRTFAVASLGKAQETRVVVTSSHNDYYPNQVAVLSTGGELLKEYWHSGALDLMQIGDMDGNGAGEIYLGGVNNAYKQATLIVLDPDTMGGASIEEDKSYQLLGFEPGRERARILFPRTCYNQRLEDHNAVLRLYLRPNNITVYVSETSGGIVVIYYMNPDLKVTNFQFSNAFQRLHKEAEVNGQLDHKMDRQKEEAEMRNIRLLKAPEVRGRVAAGR